MLFYGMVYMSRDDVQAVVSIKRTNNPRGPIQILNLFELGGYCHTFYTFLPLEHTKKRGGLLLRPVTCNLGEAIMFGPRSRVVALQKDGGFGDLLLLQEVL